MPEQKITPAMVAEAARMEKAGNLSPRAVVDAARSVKSPFHDWFNWDVDAAAQAHWEQEARRLITSIRVVDMPLEDAADRERPVQLYVRDPDADPKEQGYVKVTGMNREQAKKALDERVKFIGGNIDATAKLAAEWKLTREFKKALLEIVQSL